MIVSELMEILSELDPKTEVAAKYYSETTRRMEVEMLRSEDVIINESLGMVIFRSDFS